MICFLGSRDSSILSIHRFIAFFMSCQLSRSREPGIYGFTETCWQMLHLLNVWFYLVFSHIISTVWNSHLPICYLSTNSHHHLPCRVGKDWMLKATEEEVVGWHHWLNGPELSKIKEIVKNREGWHVVIHGVTKRQTRLSDWTTAITPSVSPLAPLPAPPRLTNGLA